MTLSEETIQADLVAKPSIDSKSSTPSAKSNNNSTTKKWLPSDLLRCKTASNYRLKMTFQKSLQSITALTKALETSSSVLARALSSGIQVNYQNFDPSPTSNPEEFLPVVRDPYLVRAFQI